MKLSLIIIPLAFQLIFTSKVAAQISPIPKFKGSLSQNTPTYKFVTYQADKLKINSSGNITTQLDSNEKFEKIDRNLKNFTDSSREEILQAIVPIQSENYKDTLLYTEGKTVYLYNKYGKTKIIYTSIIDDTRKNDYQDALRDLRSEQKKYNSIQESIERLNQLEENTEQSKKEFAELKSKREQITKTLDVYIEKLDSIDDHIIFDLDFRKFSVPVAFSFYKTRRNSSKIFNNYYYGRSDVSVLQSLEINRSKNVTNFNTELANAFFRTFRISLAANINKPDNDTSSSQEINSEYQKLITNGGQFALRIQSPLVFYHNSSDDLIFVANILNRFGFDLIPDDLNTKNNNINNFIGGDLSFFLRTEKNIFSFFAQFPIGYTFGNNKFYESQRFRDFSTLQGIFGVTIHDQFRIKFSGTFLSTQNELQRVPWTIGFQFTPSLSPKEN